MNGAHTTADPRIAQILDKVLRLAACEREAIAPPGVNAEPLDFIIRGLALLEERLEGTARERERLEVACRLERERLMGILECMEDGVCIVNRDFRAEYVNPAVEREFGPVRDRKCYEYFHDRSAPCDWCKQKEVFAGDSVHWERYDEHTGKTYELFDAPFRNPDGSTSKLSIRHNITEHKRTERMLREANELLEGIFCNVHVLIAYLDAQFNFIRVNRAYAKAAGHEPEFFAGKNHFELYPHAENEAIFRRAVETGESYSVHAKPFEHPESPQRGVTYWDWVLYPVKDRDGIVTGLLFSLVDITAHKRSEQMARESERKYRLLLDNLRQNIFLKDRQSVYLSCNRHYAQQLGIEPEAIAGKTDYHFFPEELAEKYRCDDRRIMESGAEEEIEETYWHRTTGERRVVLTVKVPVTGEHGGIVGILGIFWDITERKRIEAELRANRVNLEHLVRERTRDLGRMNETLRREIKEREQAKKALIESEAKLRQQAEQLAEADRRKDDFLAMLAHELRNPLTPIHHTLEVLKRQGQPASGPGWAMEVIAHQTKQMKRLVDDLLDIARIARGRITLQKEQVALDDVITRAVEMAQPLIEEQGHALTIDLPPQPIHLHADPARLAQVVGNLLNNATKYTPAGGRIGLTVHLEGGDAVIRVWDTGIGIPPELLRRVFEPFIQAGRALDRAQGGLGLGLSLVRTVTEMHGGSVLADSAGPGTGSTLIVRLPVVAGAPDSAPPGDTPERPTPARRRVLVVEDNLDVAKSFTMLLDVLGHEVHAVHDGISALEAVRTLDPEIVFLDIGLPGMTGYEVAQRLREAHGAALRLVAVTGYGQEQDLLRARKAGFDHHLLKPVDIDALEALLAVPPP